MGGCQNYGPFLGTLNIRGRNIVGIPKGTIILTIPHIIKQSWPIQVKHNNPDKLKMVPLSKLRLLVDGCRATFGTKPRPQQLNKNLGKYGSHKTSLVISLEARWSYIPSLACIQPRGKAVTNLQRAEVKMIWGLLQRGRG